MRIASQLYPRPAERQSAILLSGVSLANGEHTLVGMPPGIWRLCVAYDVERYSGRGTRREYATQQRLADVLKLALHEAGLATDAYELQEQGDGGIAFLPTGGTVDEPRLLVGLISALRNVLTELNEDLVEQARVRLRVGLGQGVVHRAAHGYAGPAVVDVCRLRDAEPVRTMLAGSNSPLVVVVSDGLYNDVLVHGYHGLRGSAFTPIDFQVKTFAARAWIYLPGSQSQPPELAGHDQQDQQKEDMPAGSISEFLDSPRDLW
jgi:hypothetical protein